MTEYDSEAAARTAVAEYVTTTASTASTRRSATSLPTNSNPSPWPRTKQFGLSVKSSAPHNVYTLLDIINDVRKTVWARQPADFFATARIDMDGVLVKTTGECKAGMDIAYDGTWGYHPLIVSLANTQEVLSVVNRPGNRPSHDGAAAEVDRAVKVCFDGGFRNVRLRGWKSACRSTTRTVSRQRTSLDYFDCSGPTPATAPDRRANSVNREASHRDSQPPSTTTTLPCMYWQASEARNTHRPASSDGRPQRPAGMRSRICGPRTGWFFRVVARSVSK